VTAIGDRSDAFVFFGATGDLAYKQIFPALQAMIRRGHLDVPVIGVAKAGWGIEQLRERARKSLEEHGGGVDEAAFAKLTKLLRYVDGDYRERAPFEAVRRELGDAARPIHYLAIPPTMFPVVIEHLEQSGCAKDARVIVEKPFGRDLASAQQLNQTILRVFDEASVFRIDHYLGKEAVQNLIVLRFGNTFLEPIWNRNYIESVQITMAEQFGVAGRGAFYEEAGAIRDVVQNHMMQIVGILAMEVPQTTYNQSIRDELAKVLRQVTPLSPANLVLGQFQGYRSEPGVAASSRVETFAAVRLEIDSWRWAGVPFFIRAGKCLPLTSTEVIVQLRRPPVKDLGEGNVLRLRLTPDVRIAMSVQEKKPGEAMASEPSEFTLIQSKSGDEMAPYERLLGDAMVGDCTLFAREDAVEAAWRVVQPVLGKVAPVHEYAPGTWGPTEAAALTASVGGWAKMENEP
jgi:glucose-6-phosphate 1-dehydrogenase